LFILRIFSDVKGFLTRLSLIRLVVLLGLTFSVFVSLVVWVWTQDPTWAYVTLVLLAFAWAAFGTSVAQISRTD